MKKIAIIISLQCFAEQRTLLIIIERQATCRSCRWLCRCLLFVVVIVVVVVVLVVAIVVAIVTVVVVLLLLLLWLPLLLFYLVIFLVDNKEVIIMWCLHNSRQ